MKLCVHCEVEVEEDSPYCPLCRNPLQAVLEEEKMKPASPPHNPRETSRHVRRWILEVLSVLAVTGALVVFAADFATDLSLSWALYPLASIAFVWLSVVLAMFCSHRAWIYIPTQVATACLFFFALDRFTPEPTWFLPLAMPMTVLMGAILALTVIVVRKAGLSPVATIAAALVAAGVFVVGLELLLNSYLDHRWFISWSAVAFVCMLPLVFLLLYLRRWLRARQEEIRKLLHL
jgi:hypothetical protein